MAKNNVCAYSSLNKYIFSLLVQVCKEMAAE